MHTTVFDFDVVGLVLESEATAGDTGYTLFAVSEETKADDEVEIFLSTIHLKIAIIGSQMLAIMCVAIHSTRWSHVRTFVSCALRLCNIHIFHRGEQCLMW